jgi:beta-fructofuranosidase
MNIDRRDFLAGLIGTAAVSTLGKNLSVAPVLASTVPAGLAKDPRRPQFHLLPAANWMNDPNAPIYWQGNYHMFYQYNPNAAVWGDMHWAHAMSQDMVHWRHLPIALAPTPGGPDAGGCFTGTAVVDGDRVAVLYTGVVPTPEDKATIRDGVHSMRETQCLAIGSGKDLTTWTKIPQPVIAAPPEGLNVSGFRDPSPWRQGDRWYMVVGSGIRGERGAVLLYESTDLRHWKYLHIAASGVGKGTKALNQVDSGDMWECPDLFPLGDKHVLIYSSEGKAIWQSGVLDPKELLFHAEHQGILDSGSYYAPKTQLDRAGNRILWGWVLETRPVQEFGAAGWAGMMSLPRVLTLDGNGQLNMQVADEVRALRQKEQHFERSSDEAQNQRQIATMRLPDCCGEILCTTGLDTNSFGFEIANPDLHDASSWLSVHYDTAQPDQITIDGKPLPVRLTPKGKLELHFYIDGSVIELFVNKQFAFTKRFYYPGSSAPPTGIRITGTTALISTLSIWSLTPISSDRLTT